MAELLIDTEAVRCNYNHYAARGTVIPVLKKDGYGLGAEAMRALLAIQGAALFACATPEEALRLAGKGSDILLLSCEYNSVLLGELARKDVILSLESLEQAKLLQSLGTTVRIHLAVDTGFGRFGFHWQDTAKMRAVFYLDRIRVCGIFSHFRSMDSAPLQFERFSRVLETLADYPVGLRHVAATSCAQIPEYRLDAVRIGSGLVGYEAGLSPAAQLTARVCTVRHLCKGSRIGYGNTRLKRDTDVAIVDTGTGDGAFLQRGCGLRAWWCSRHRTVTVNEQQAAVLGLPELTHTAIDVTGLSCTIGDVVQIAQTPILISPHVPKRYIACYSAATGCLVR